MTNKRDDNKEPKVTINNVEEKVEKKVEEKVEETAIIMEEPIDEEVSLPEIKPEIKPDITPVSHEDDITAKEKREQSRLAKVFKRTKERTY